MIKTFVYKNLTVKVKTNQLKNGIAYFGEQNIVKEAEGVYKKAEFINGKDGATDILVVQIFNDLKILGIAPYEVAIGNVAYRGTKLTDVTTQTKLEE